MPDESADPRRIIEETDWAAVENRDGPAKPRTPTMLLGLTSGDLAVVEHSLFHLSYELIEFPNVYSAAVPAAKYVAALLGDPASSDLLRLNGDVGPRALRAHLLAWLAKAVDSVGDAMVHSFVGLAGYSPLEYPDSTFRKMREIRPQIFAGVATCLDDRDPVVRKEAVAAAVVCAQAEELAAQRVGLIPLVRSVLADSSDSVHRQWASAALETW
jgi:hypothetical protein